MKTGLILSSLGILGVSQAAPLPVTELKREKPVDFASEVHPLLKKNCLACHSATKPKADLNLESPQSMIKGGESGPAIVPGKSGESLLLTLATHADDPVMPPEGNKMNAENFTPDELGLIKLWIDQGAKGQGVILTAPPKEWRNPAKAAYPIYHAALSPSGRFAAASRANQVTVYDLSNGTEIPLSDPELSKLEMYQGQAVVDRDFVQSLAFSSQDWLATGGYRSVKIWRRNVPSVKRDLGEMSGAVTALAVSEDGRWAASGDANGAIRLWNPSEPNSGFKDSKDHSAAVTGLAFTSDGEWLVSSSLDKTILHRRVSENKVTSKLQHPGPVRSMTLLAAAGFVAAGGEDGLIRLFAFPPQAEAKPSKEWKGHAKTVNALASLPSEAKSLLSGSDDGKAILWNLESGAPTKQFDHGTAISAVAASPDGKKLLTVGGVTTKLWNAAEAKVLSEIKATPAQRQKEAEWSRTTEVAKRLIDARKKKLTETEKAWKDEIGKAKEAAVAEEKTRVDFSAKEKAAYDAALLALAEGNRAQTAASQWEELKRKAAEASESAKSYDGRIAEEVGRAKALLAQVEQESGALNSALTKATEPVKQAVALREGQTKTAKDLENALANLKAAKSDLGENDLSQTAIAATEKLLAEVERRLGEARAQEEAAIAEQAKVQQQLAELAKRKSDSSAGLKALQDEKAQALKSAEDLKKQAAQMEAESKQFAEAAKKSSESSTKAATARDEAAKELGRATQNVELAVKLVGQASIAHAKIEAAHSGAENLLATTKATTEASQKSANDGAKPLRAAVFSKDSRWLAIAGDDQSISTWEVETGKGMDSFTAQGGAISQICFLPNGELLAGGSTKKTLHWKHQASWSLVHSLGKLDDPQVIADRVTSLAFNHSGTLLASGGGMPSRSGELKLWDVATGKLLQSKPEAHSDTIVGISFSPNADYLATAATDRFVKVFRVGDLSLVNSFEGHTSHVLGVAWRADGLALASGGADNVIKLWDFEEKRQLQTLNGFDKEVTSVSFVGTGDTVLSGAGDNALRLGNERLDAKDFVYAADVSADGEIAISASQDSVLRVWNMKTKQVAREFPAKK